MSRVSPSYECRCSRTAFHRIHFTFIHVSVQLHVQLQVHVQFQLSCEPT
jgi:hypothetical protein